MHIKLKKLLLITPFIQLILAYEEYLKIVASQKNVRYCEQYVYSVT
jgi:hypothetical protein